MTPQLTAFSVSRRPPPASCMEQMDSRNSHCFALVSQAPVPACPYLSPFSLTAEAWCVVTSVESRPSHTAGLLKTEARDQNWLILDPSAPGQFLVHSRCSINACGSPQYLFFSMTQNLTRYHDFLGT